MSFKLCIFDLDGTLTDTIRAIAHFGNLALAAYDMGPIETDKYKIYVGDGRDKLIHRILDVYGADNEEMFEKVGAVYDANYENDFLYETKPYDGIRELLADLKAKGIKLAVCSNKPDNVVNFVVNHFFGEGYFDAVRGIKNGMPTKPDAGAALDIARAAGVSTEECIFIGDTNVDIFTAKNAGMTSVGVLWGFRTREELVRAGADYIAETPRVIAQLCAE